MAAYTISRRLMALFAVTVAVVVLAGGIYSTEQRRNLREAAENDLTVIAQLKVGEIERWRDDLVDDAEVLAMGPPLAAVVTGWLSGSGAADEAAVVAALDSITRHASYHGVLLFDAAGELRLASRGSTPVSNQEVADAVAQSLREQRPLLTDLHLDESGQPHMGVVAPVFAPGEDGAPIAALVLQTDAEHILYPVVQSWPTASESAETLLVRRDGDSVLFLNDLRHRPGAALTLREPLSNIELPAVMAVLGAEGVVEGVDYRGVEVVAVVYPIPGSTWYMVAKVDKDEVLSALRSTSALIVVLILALLFAAVTVFGLVWQRQEKAHYSGLVAEQARAAESEQRFRLLVESSPDAILVQTDGWFAYVNAAAVRLFGAAHADELLGTPLLDRLPQAFRDEARQRILRLNNERQAVPPIEEQYLTMNGAVVPVEVSGVPIKFEGNDGALEFVRDITERKQTMEALRKSEDAVRELNTALEQRIAERTAQLEASNKELEAFAYSVSHDLRAPLRAIEGFSRILLEDHADALDAEGRRLLGVVRSSTARMDKLITDLLSLSRVSQSELHPVLVDMVEMVHSVREELLTAGIGEAFEFAVGGLPGVQGDPILLKRVWYNLLANAFKFTSQSAMRRVEVGGYSDGSLSTYYVRDTGAGFDVKYAHQLFGVFQRLHSRDEFEGTGIGLAIVQRIVHRHGGRVWAEGEVGRGATFYFALPGGEKEGGESTK
jgi:PAS domain S-box-containing protein